MRIGKFLKARGADPFRVESNNVWIARKIYQYDT